MTEKFRVVRILWAAFVVSQLMFAAVVFMMPRASTPQGPMLAPAFGAVALALIVMSFVLPRRLLMLGLRQRRFEVSEGVAEQPDRFGGFYRNAADKERVFTHPKQALAGALPVFQTSFIIALGMSEAVTVLGLALAVTGTSPLLFVPFFVVGAVLVLLRYPTLRSLGRSLEQAYGASLGPTAGQK